MRAKEAKMISCNDLYKNFSDKMVLSGININVGAGEIFGLLGPSGAGKGTICSRMIFRSSSEM